MNQEQLAKMVAQAVATALGGNKPAKASGKKAKGGGRQKLTDAERSQFQSANDAECVKVFTAAGFTDVKPRENVLTYKKWLAKGRMVSPGQKSHKVSGFSLFHENQTQPVQQVTEATQTANTVPA